MGSGAGSDDGLVINFVSGCIVTHSWLLLIMHVVIFANAAQYMAQPSCSATPAP